MGESVGAWCGPVEPLNLHSERYMSDNNIELTRRRVLGGIATVGAASAAVGAGTFAAFSDTEQSSGNTVTAGTLDLQLNPNSSGNTSISFTNIAPGDSGSLVIELGNGGSVDANLASVNIGDAASDGSFTGSLITDSDGTNSEFETDPTSDGGELDDNLTVDVFIEANGDLDSNASVGTTQGSTVNRSGNETNVVSSGTVLANALGTNSVTDTLNPGTTRYLVVNYTLPSVTENVVQGDSVEFDVQVLLDQA